ncbi:GNAT family N-acetyltransferase [Lentiprolixibacter aurantiacus]|uniref:GNAT family N-acetyltransferase n=1 Tax=Lentiprolixibacter aurantiacus TaxID=2993939 RepID=A0AAE3MKP4_9FLAO|nr:GNAT family N-acetyltransferase [Lentiprolixibacter aurantiacus]MCX2719525.1 GNAT family N-acetyltransferase [Lentiprolixibacter aurantiacus]
MTTFINAKDEKAFTLIAHLARTIWEDHYTPIIGSEQVSYMLNKFQSVEAIAEQVSRGVQYHLIFYNSKPAGYLAFEKKLEELFLSKIYVSKEMRGKGIGKEAMAFIEREGRHMDCTQISLTVNKHNTGSIKAYEKLGFHNLGGIVQDIGQGYIMDDFLLIKSL